MDLNKLIKDIVIEDIARGIIEELIVADSNPLKQLMLSHKVRCWLVSITFLN